MTDVNSKGTNAKIKAHILPDEEMRKIGFTDFYEPHWYFSKLIGHEISFTVTIPKDGSDIEILTLDEDFCQPYDYQYMLDKNPTFEFALKIKEKVEKQMEYLQNAGVLSGHVKGEYI